MPLFVLAELRLGVARSLDFYASVRRDIERVRTIPHTIEKREGFGHDLWIAALCLQHGVPLLTNDSSSL